MYFEWSIIFCNWFIVMDNIHTYVTNHNLLIQKFNWLRNWWLIKKLLMCFRSVLHMSPFCWGKTNFAKTVPFRGITIVVLNGGRLHFVVLLRSAKSKVTQFQKIILNKIDFLRSNFFKVINGMNLWKTWIILIRFYSISFFLC